MLRYKKQLHEKEQFLKRYCKELKRLKKHNTNINKLNEFILSNTKCIKISGKYVYPNKLYAYIKDYYKKNNYQIKFEDIVECLNDYKKVFKYRFSYWELKELKIVSYYIMIEAFCGLIQYEPENILRHSIRKEKTVYNIIKSIDNIIALDIQKLIEEVSDTEKLLLTISEYQDLTLESKIKYQNKIIEKSTDNKITEYQYTEKLVKTNTSLAQALFTRLNYSKINTMIILISMFSSIVICLVLFNKLPIIMNILGIVINYYLFYKFYSLFVPKEELLEYAKKDILKTMCVRYIVLNNDTEVIEELDRLEQFYIDNKDKNIHFSLLVDCTDCDHQIEPFDNEILEVGLNKVEELNNKYEDNIFYFVYRKRAKNGLLWQGYNRKNGAIEEFIHLLNGEISSSDDYELFMGHSDFNTCYKYLVEMENNIDVKRLINILEHPYNEATCKANKIENGYAAFSDNGKILYGETQSYSNFALDLDIYNRLLKRKMPDNILHSSLLKCGSINNKQEKNIYDKESILKNNISMLGWVLNKNSSFNQIQKIKYIHTIIASLISIMSFILFIFSYISDYSALLVLYYGIINFVIINIPWYINIKVLVKYLFNKEYRHNVIELKNNSYIIDFVLIGIMLLIGLYLNLNMWNIILSAILIVLSVIKKYIYD